MLSVLSYGQIKWLQISVTERAGGDVKTEATLAAMTMRQWNSGAWEKEVG